MGAAVLVPIVRTESGEKILFEVRSDFVSQPGEICFPGGRIEPGEDAIEAAFRETEEELGIPRASIKFIRCLEADSTIAGKVIQPILAEVEESALGNIAMSDCEVKDFFLAPTEWFIENRVREYHTGDELPEILAKYLENYKNFRGKTDYWEYEGHGIWGITARLLKRYIGEVKESRND